MKHAALSVVLAFYGITADAQTQRNADLDLGDAIGRVIDADVFSNAFWGVHVVDVAGGRTLYTRNADKSFVPASNTKLYTTAAVLDQLGPTFRFDTELYVDGPIVAGVLRGNVVVRGAADPTIGGHYDAESGEWDEDVDATRIFRDWADSLRAAGVRRIDGDIIGDDDVIDDVPLGVNWSWDDETYYYSAQLGGLTFHDNVVHMYVTSRERDMPAEIRWEPFDTDYVRVINRTRTVGAYDSLEEGYRRLRGTNTVEVTTLVPEGREDVEEITVENPTKYFVHVLRECLLRSGIAIAGQPVDVDELSIKPDYSDPRFRRVAVHRSEPLEEIVAIVNKPSQNLYADLLLKKLADAFPKEEEDLEPGSSEMGIDVAMATFVRAGIDTSRLRLVDGSGLSRLNLVMPEMTTSLLSYMWHHDDERVRHAFRSSLPVAGETGTLRNRMTRSPAAGRMRGKTGSLTFVSSLSGYVRTESGRTLAVSLMSNHFTSKTSRIRDAQDAIVDILVRSRP